MVNELEIAEHAINTANHALTKENDAGRAKIILDEAEDRLFRINEIRQIAREEAKAAIKKAFGDTE